MPDHVKAALLELRAAERELSSALARAMRSRNPRRHQRLGRHIAAAEKKIRRLEKQLRVA